MRTTAPERISPHVDASDAGDATPGIVAADVPRHRDHLAVALMVSLMIALAGALAIVMVPRPASDVRYLEQARSIGTRALAERDRRRMMKPLRVPARPHGDQLTWAPGASLELSMRAQEAARAAEGATCEAPHAFDAFDGEAWIEAPLSREVVAGEESFDDVATLASASPSASPEERAATAATRAAPAARSSKTPPRKPAFVCRHPSRDAVRVWFEQHVRPVLRECMNDDMPTTEVRSAVTLTFDQVGRVATANLGSTMSERYVTCAQPKLTALALPDAYELTFTWPFVLVP